MELTEVASASFQLLAESNDPAVRQGCYPKAPLNEAIDRFKPVLGTSINQPKQALDNGCRGTISFKVHQRLPVTGSSDLRGLLSVVCKILDIQA